MTEATFLRQSTNFFRIPRIGRIELLWLFFQITNSQQPSPTLKCLIEEHACLNFSDFHSTLLSIFHAVNEKFHPASLFIYLVNKQAGWHLFPALLVYSGLLFY